MTIHDFDTIRPFLPEELPAAFDSLLADPSFCAIMQSFFKDVPFEHLKAKLYACQNSLEVQKTFYPLVKNLVAQCCTSINMEAEAIAPEQRTQNFTFVSNHRDIVLDAAFLSILMLDNGFQNTVEIAIGDNLLIYPWIRTLVRINKSFIVQRSVGMREMLLSSKRMSQYMHFAIAEKHENIWIAQREGRAKDSNDRTQESVLKMMAMGGEGSVIDSLKQLNIVPLTISYEYDPCDFLKAKEFQQKRDNPEFKKSRQDDLTNMQTGIFGFKGKVIYRLAAPVNSWIDECRDLPKAEVFKAIAQRMDNDIHRNYEIYPCNYIAYDWLNQSQEMAGNYTENDVKTFEDYLNKRIEMIDLPNKDIPFLRERLLTMYANPLINHLNASKGA